MQTPKDTSLLTFEPPPRNEPLERPKTHTWTGPCKSAGCNALRDFIVLALVSAAIAYACVGLGIL